MAVQIDRMETSVEVASPTTGTTTRPPSPTTTTDPGASTAFRDAVMQVLADELAEFSRIRGH